MPITDKLTKLMFSGISSYHANRTLRILQGQEVYIIGETVSAHPVQRETRQLNPSHLTELSYLADNILTVQIPLKLLDDSGYFLHKKSQVAEMYDISATWLSL